MPAETLTYAAITDRLGFSSAFRGFINRLRLPWQSRNNGIAVAASLIERPAVSARSLEDDQRVVATLKARIETLEAEFARVEAAATVHRADFERERERCERLMAEVLKATGRPRSNGTDRWRTRGSPSAAVVALSGRLTHQITAQTSRRS
jgi:hypothetical protein